MKLGFAVSVLVLAGCGVAQFTSRQEPRRAFGEFGSVEVREIRNGLSGRLPGDVAAQAEAFSKTLAVRVKEKLVRAGRFTEAKAPVLVIEGELVGYDPGSQALRYLIGFGAGSGEIRVEVAFRDPEGALVADGTARGTVSGGFFGGTVGEAENRVAEAIVRHIESHWERRP